MCAVCTHRSPAVQMEHMGGEHVESRWRGPGEHHFSTKGGLRRSFPADTPVAEEGHAMWSDDRVELLRKLWSEGLSASQIASRLGGVTRNAVIGKVHRLGLAGRATTARSRTPRRRSRVSHLPLRPPR